MQIAVLNAGSATVKSARIELDGGSPPRTLERHSIERREGEPLEDAFDRALDRVDHEDVAATAHRVVHGGPRFRRAVRVDDEIEEALAALGEMAPLHNPPALLGIRIARRRLPTRPAVAVFDTAFHADRPATSLHYALPADLVREHSLYRYGFHGLAHASLVESLARARGAAPEEVDAVTLQLGSGCSACAVAAGRSIETSMGFTPLEGLPMATRPGDVDPGVVLHLLRGGRTIDEVERLLHRESGLLGVGGDADVRTLLDREARGDERAALALALFVRRVVARVGAYWTLLEGRGALVFGGGIGTHSAPIRRRICDGLRAWNVELAPDPVVDGNASRAREAPRGAAPGAPGSGEEHGDPDPGLVSAPGRREVWVFTTREEPLIAREAATVLRDRGAAP